MKPTVKGLPKSTDKVKADPFICVKSINNKGAPLTEDEIQFNYDAFLVNRSMSNTFDTVLFANEVNLLNITDKVMAYHFYFYGVDKKPSRYGAWNKASVDADVKVIMEYYDYSRAKAREVLPLLAGRIDQLKQELDKGGSHGKRN